ncbi:MAG TPA: branched-chain amino acid ABC transporter permease [Polyangiaceae bacterium]|nr:branched-chain amino acid ABC transporter permease [Polyangiaceae bacterium]
MAEQLKRSYLDDLTIFEGTRARLLFFGLLAGICLFGLSAGEYALYVATTLAVFVIAATGLNLLVGYTGQISLGHAAFLAIGAYTHVLLYTQGLPFFVSAAAGALVAGSCGWLLGLPALKLRGPYLAICTLGFQVAVDQILGRWESVTGGRMGLGVPAPDEVAGLAAVLGIGKNSLYFLVCAALTTLTLLGVYNLARSRVGRALVAIRDNETAAEAAGVDLVRYKTLSFALSAAITGLAGALCAHLFDRINPSNFTLMLSIELLVMVLVGGLASVLGSVLGAALLVLSQNLLSSFRDYQSIVVGGILITVLLFEPMGLRGRWLRMKYYLKAWPF